MLIRIAHNSAKTFIVVAYIKTSPPTIRSMLFFDIQLRGYDAGQVNVKEVQAAWSFTYLYPFFSDAQPFFLTDWQKKDVRNIRTNVTLSDMNKIFLSLVFGSMPI